MAYGEKYFIDYCDDFNVSRRVSILKKDYLGATTELTAGETAINITYDSNSDFMFSTIRPSKAEVFMIFDTESGVDFEEFWTADEREYKIEDKEGVTVKWVGYVIPDGFQYDFTGGKYYASLNASDGLSTLESYPFVDDNQQPYGIQRLTYNDQTDSFEFPPSLILTEILRKLGLDLDLWTCVDSYEKSMTKVGDVRYADPLSACYLNTKTYIKLGKNTEIPYWHGSGVEWNCKEVVENILTMFAAKLYQQDGVWRVKGHNVDVDNGTGATQRYWRRYNTACVYLSPYEPVNDIVNIPCNDTSTFLLNNDHVIRMDDVYKSFRINYEYTLTRTGDSPVNLIKNGDFSNFDDISSGSAPVGWSRVRAYNPLEYIRIKKGVIGDPAAIDGNATTLVLGTQRSPDLEGTTNLMYDGTAALYNGKPSIKKSDKIFFDIWNRYVAKTNRSFTMVYRCVIISDDGSEKYFLGNKDNSDGVRFEWIKSTSGGADLFVGTGCFNLNYLHAKSTNSIPTLHSWYNHKEEFPPSPVSGVLWFFIHGLGATRFTGRSTVNENSYPVFYNGNQIPNWRYASSLSFPEVTGVFLGIIPSGEDLPEQQYFYYGNENPLYTLQEKPLTVYNGDVENELHLSRIKVPTNTSGKNFWNDLSESFSNSSLGLLTVKEIMKQYQLPYRIFEGDLKVQNAKFDSVYTFEALPNIKFALIRGTFNKQRQFLEGATFRQIATDVLPEGGNEGGNTLSPDWVETGNFYCQQTSNVNTGYVIVEERDENPNSETYGDTREVVSDNQDLDTCPIGLSRRFYFGSQNQYLDTSLLSFSPYNFVDSKTITYDYSNTEGNYLYFVSLKTIGVVERIYTTTSPNNVISDWVELEDVLIGGALYRVLRTDYIMTEFSNFTHNFQFANTI